MVDDVKPTLMAAEGTAATLETKSTKEASQTIGNREPGKLSQIRKFLATPAKTRFQGKSFFAESVDDVWVTPLTRAERRTLWSFWATLWVLLIALISWSRRIPTPKLVSIEFGEAKDYVQQLCRMRPPLNISSVLDGHPSRKQVYGTLLCSAKNVFHLRHGVADESPIPHECEAPRPEHLKDLQTISDNFLAQEICKRILGTTNIVCRPHQFILEQLCIECSSFASGMRLILLQEMMVDLFGRGWLSPQTYFYDRTLMVPLDTVLLAYVAGKTQDLNMVKVMEQALVVTENIAIQDLTRPWETIELHAFELSAKNVVKDITVTPGAVQMSGNQFYWMLRVENYCAPRFPHSKREASDFHYMVVLENVLTILNVSKH